MSDHDVFIGYASADRPLAKALAERLEARGLTVWWDTDLIGGDLFHAVLEQKIDGAGKVVILWTQTSRVSGFVIDEANRGKAQGKLVPVEVDDAQSPMGFGDIHKLNLSTVEMDIELVLRAVWPAERGPIPLVAPVEPTPEPEPVMSALQSHPADRPPRWITIFASLALGVGAMIYATWQEGPPVLVDDGGQARAEPSLIYDGPPIEATPDYIARFADLLTENNITRVSAEELLVMGASHSDDGNQCYGRNHVPPERLWSKVLPVAKALSLFRGLVEEEVRVVSAYRSVAYNSCIGGATRSTHLTFEALDLRSPTLSPEALAEKWRNLRDDGLYSGGIGVYSTFIHVDARGRNVDWDQGR